MILDGDVQRKKGDWGLALLFRREKKVGGIGTAGLMGMECCREKGGERERWYAEG